MAYNNKMPNIGKTLQSVRDIDFISITEVKAFDALIDEIVVKLSVIGNETATDVNNAINIAQEIKKIEFNMADAINKDGSFNVSDSPDPITEETGGPVYGEWAIDKMLTKLDELYQKFISLVGEHQSEWKIPLENYYNSVYNNFKSTITAIFTNSVNSQILEQKVNSDLDYTKSSPKKLVRNEVYRLNPDTAAMPRNINIKPTKINTDYIVFEVTELETDSLVLHFNFFNGKNYFRYNVIIDKKEVFITKEESFKYNDNTYIIKIWKRTANNANKYTFTFSTNKIEDDEIFSFEIEGLLVNTYDFSYSGFDITYHKDYYEYELVDKEKVDVPVYNETYYYKEEVVSSDTDSDKQYTYRSVTNLRNWKSDIEYSIRKCNFEQISTINIEKDRDSGSVNIDNKTIDNKDVVSDSNPLVIDDKRYTKPLYYQKIDMDSSKLFGSNNRQNYLKNHKFYNLDDGIEFEHNANNTFIKHSRPTSLNGKTSFGIGNKVAQIFDLEPNSYVQVPYFKSKKFIDVSNDTYINRSEYGVDNIEVESKKNFPATLDNFLLNDESVIDNILSFKINDDTVIMPQFDYTPITDDNILTDVSILKYKPETKTYVSMTDSSVPAINYIPYKIGDDIFAVANGYDKLINLNCKDSLNKLILKYNTITGMFEEYEDFDNMFDNISFVEYIREIKVQALEDNSLIRFLIYTDKNDKENECSTIIYNNSKNKITVPEIVNKYQPYSVGGALTGYKFISSASAYNLHKVYSVDQNGDLWYSEDGTSFIKETRTHITTIDNTESDQVKFKSIYCDTEDRWFALSADETPRLLTSQNGYDWNQIDLIKYNEDKEITLNESESIQEKIVWFKNLTINRYFIASEKYLYISEDGFNWIKTNVPSGTWRDIAYNTKKFVVVGHADDIVATTESETTVTENSGVYCVAEGYDINTIANGFLTCTGLTGNWFNVTTYSEDIFVISGDKGVRYSNANYGEETAAITFASQPATVTNANNTIMLSSVTDEVNGKLFFTSKNAGITAEGTHYNGWIDKDNNIIWGSFLDNNYRFNGVAYSPTLKIYVAATEINGLFYSYDGRFWAISNITSSANTTREQTNACYWDEQLSRFFATNGSTLYWSDDGKTWTQITSGSWASNTGFYRINDTTLLLGLTNSNVYYSIVADGKSGWTACTGSTGSVIHSIVTNADKTIWVMCSNSGLKYSTDGKTWTVSNVTSAFAGDVGRSGSVVYDKTNNKFYACGNLATDKNLYQSVDGKTWTSVKVFDNQINCVCTNGKAIVVSEYAGTGIYYSGDGGANFIKISTIDSKYILQGLKYVESRNTFYVCASNYPQIWYSKNGSDWTPLVDETIWNTNLSDSHAVSTRTEDPTAIDIIGFHFIWKGKNLYRSRDGKVWQKVTYTSDINAISFVGLLENKEVFLTLKNGGIYKSTVNNESYNKYSDMVYSTYGESFEQTNVKTGDYGIAVSGISDDQYNTNYLIPSNNEENSPYSLGFRKNKDQLIQVQKLEPNNIVYLSNYGNSLLAADHTGYLQYNKLDKIYTPNVIIRNKDIIFTKSVQIPDEDSKFINSYYILGLSDKTIIANDKNNVFKTYSDLILNDVKVITNNTVSKVYGFKKNGGIVGLTIEGTDTTNTTEFPTLSDYDIEYMFQRTNGNLIIIGRKDTQYTIFESNDKSTVSTLASFTGSIRCIDFIDNNIILLAYEYKSDGTVDKNKRIFFDNINNKIVKSEIVDIDNIIDFTSVTSFNGEIYTVNTIEAENGVHKYSLNKVTLASDGSLVLTKSDNNDFESTSEENWSIFIFKNNLYFSCYSNDDNSGIWIVKSSGTTSGWNLVKADDFISDFFTNNMTGEIIQQSNLDESIEVLSNDESAFATEDVDYDSETNKFSSFFKNDRIYFDKETKGITLGKYRNTDGRFKLYQEMITAVKSEIDNNINIAIALGVDAKIAFYDRKYDFLKVLDFKYAVDNNTKSYILNISDSEDAVITNVYSGYNKNKNWIYFVVKDKFPDVTNDGYGNYTVTPKTTFSNRLFKVSCDDINANINEDKITCTWIQYAKDPTVVENVKSQMVTDVVTKTDALEININKVDQQYIIHGINLKYDNVDSIAWFNVDAGCLVITSKLNFISDIEDEAHTTEDFNDDILTAHVVAVQYDKNKTLKQNNKAGSDYAMILDTKNDGTITTKNVQVDFGPIANINGNIIGAKYDNLYDKFTYDSTNKNIILDASVSSLGLNSKLNCVATLKNGYGLLLRDLSDITNITHAAYLMKFKDCIRYDTFSDGSKLFYNHAKDTSFGLFRFFKTDETIYRSNEYETNSIPYKTGYLYLTTKDHKLITIDPGSDSFIIDLWETYVGVFINYKSIEKYNNQEVTVYKTALLINIPSDSDYKISIKDERYFKAVDTGEDPVIDMAETQYGIFAITYLEVRTLIWRWNGDDFYTIKKDLNYAYGYKRIFDTLKGVFFIGNKKEIPVGTYDLANDTVNNTSYEIYINDFMNRYHDNSFTFQTNRGIFITGIKNNTTDTLTIYELTKGKTTSVTTSGSIGLPQELTIRVNGNSELAKYIADNQFDRLSKKLVEDYDIPVDVPIKTSGNIVLNGVIVPIKAMKIISETGVNNDTPNNITFVIDEDARFNDYSWNKIKDCVTDGNISGIKDFTKKERISKINLSLISSHPFDIGGGV